jgi:hypothetical protein
MPFYPVIMRGPVPESKALPGFFLCIFSSLTCMKEPVFSKRIFCNGRYQPGWDLLTSRKYQPACHYFKKVKKSQLGFM